MFRIVENEFVVLAIGGIGSLGLTEEMMDAVFRGESGIEPLPKEFNKCETRIGGKVDEALVDATLARFFGKKAVKNLKRGAALHALYALIAAVEGLTRAGLITELPVVKFPDSVGERMGCYIGTGIGASDEVSRLAREYAQLPDPDDKNFTKENRNLSRRHNLTGLKILPDSAAYTVSGQLNIKGPVDCLIKACATGAGNIFLATIHLALGFADVAIAGGTEKITPEDVKAFNTLGPNGALSKNNEHPDLASRPYDEKRDGFVPAEGAWIVVIATLSYARAQGATILARLTGFGETTDGTGGADPQAKDQIRAMQNALDMANTPGEVDLVIAHGTSTPVGDPVDLGAITSVVGKNRRYGICAPKSEVGHLLGASGSFGICLGVEAIVRQQIPPTINLENRIPEAVICKLEGHSHTTECYLNIPSEAQASAISKVLVTSFGFGGQNVAAAIEKY